MEKTLPPGIGFTPETKHTRLVNKQKVVNENDDSSQASSRQSNFSEADSILVVIYDRKFDTSEAKTGPCEPPESSSVRHRETGEKDALIERLENPDVSGIQPSLSEPVKVSELSNRRYNSERRPEAISTTVHVQNSTADTKKKIRNGASLSGDDLEDDSIYAVDCRSTVLQELPDVIPVARVPLKKATGTGCLFKTIPKESDIFIQHSLATDSILGDKFGAKIKTLQTDKVDYFEHFFTDITRHGVADHMKIRSNDQLVFLNGTFAPDVDHKKVKQLFSGVPVDSQTRLSLILLRHTDNELLWIKTSAILVPGYHKEPTVWKPHFDESSLTCYEERHLVRLKAPGTCQFITIVGGDVRLEMSKYDGNMSRYDISVWERCKLDSSTGRLSYSACLYRPNQQIPYQNDYVTVVSTNGVSCSTKPDPQWFRFSLSGNKMSFKDTVANEWLCCRVSSSGIGRFDLEAEEPYYFESNPVEKKVNNRTSDPGAAGVQDAFLGETNIDNPYLI